MKISSLHLLLTNKENGDYKDSLFSPPENTKEIEFDVAIWLMKESRKNGATSIYFGGGEPLLHSRIKELIKEAKKLNYYIEIETSGKLFLENIIWLKNIGINAFNVPLLGITPETHDPIRGKHSYWENLSAAETIKNFGCKLGIRYIFGRHNIFESTDIISFIDSLNPDYSIIREALPFGRSLDNKLCLNKEEAERYYNKIRSTIKKTKIAFSFNYGGPPYGEHWSCKSLRKEIIACNWDSEVSHCRTYMHGCPAYIINKKTLNCNQFTNMCNILDDKIDQFWKNNPDWLDGCERCLDKLRKENIK